MAGVSAMEMNEVRPFFSKAMSTLIHLKTENVGTMPGAEDAGMEYA